MTTRRIVLLSSVILLAILPFVVPYYRGKATREIISKYPEYIPITEILPVHEGRIKERVDLLKKQTLEETFVYLLDDRQYFYPFYNPVGFGPMDMERLLSTRSTLKVLQQFDALSRARAIEKLNEFCQKAIKDFRTSLENVRIVTDEKEIEKLDEAAREYPPTPETGKVKYPLCISLLLAARVGDYQLLVNLLDEMQQIVDAMIDRINNDDSFPPVAKVLFPQMMPLEDDCILTVLLCALKRAGKNTDIPFVSGVMQKNVPLCRWDAALTHYDFAIWHGDRKLDPRDVVEQFVVYEFPNKLFFNDPDGQKQKVIYTLKERLSESFHPSTNP